MHTLYRDLLNDRELPTMSMAASLEGINALRLELGLIPVDRLANLLDRSARVLVACPRELDRPGEVPANVRYVGPMVEYPGDDGAWRPPKPDLPLIVISLGTTPMDEEPLLQRILDALSDAPVQVVANCGSHIDRTVLRVPANASLEGYVRHSAVMPHASLVVTHAGLGSVMAALANGVPMVCLPLGREQPQNAAAVQRAGAGTVLSKDASVEKLRRGILETLQTRTYREAAQSLAQRAGNGGAAAASEVEAMARGS